LKHINNLKKKFNLTKPSTESLPTVFHITHYKSGSQWVLAVLNEVAENRIIAPQVGATHVTDQPMVAGMIYPCVYLPQPAFTASNPPENKRIFIVIRDLRDTLVSLYFSVRNSHQIVNPAQQELRDALRAKKTNEGLLLLMDRRLHVSARIQTTWIDNENLIVRYEDLIRDEQAEFKKIISYCNIDMTDDALSAAVNRHSFENRAGRKRGEEDVNSHHRKGVSGDWQNYFDEKLIREFKKRYGNVLVQTGYEKDNNW
jgi:lipopolysaccharide transport system ATP-binding protein